MRLGHIKETVRLKMREQAPALFRRLKAAGTLEATLLEMADDLENQVVDAAVSAGNDPKVRDKGLERIQAMDAAGRQMREILLAELEFPEDEPTHGQREQLDPQLQGMETLNSENRPGSSVDPKRLAEINAFPWPELRMGDDDAGQDPTPEEMVKIRAEVAAEKAKKPK